MGSVRVQVMWLIYACVLAIVVILSETKPSYDISQLRKSKYNTNYLPQMGQISEDRYLPLIYGHPLLSHYSLPFGYNHDLHDFSAPSCDQKLTKPHSKHGKYKKKSSKHHHSTKYEGRHRSKKKYPWSKYETAVRPGVYEQEFDRESYRPYEYDSKSRYSPPSYHDHMYAHQEIPLREHVNIYITPPSKKRSTTVGLQSSDEGYKTSQPYRYPWVGGQCPSPSSYGRVYRSPMLGYDHVEGLEDSTPIVEYDPSAETSLQLYRQALYGSSSSSSSSSSLSDDSAPYGGRGSYYPKRSPQHPEEFLASLTNETSSTVTAPPPPQQQVGDGGAISEPVASTSTSEDTLTYINRILAAQSQYRRSQNGNKQDASNSEDFQTDYSIFGEGYSDSEYPTIGYLDTDLGDGDVDAHNETMQVTTPKEHSDSISK